MMTSSGACALHAPNNNGRCPKVPKTHWKKHLKQEAYLFIEQLRSRCLNHVSVYVRAGTLEKVLAGDWMNHQLVSRFFEGDVKRRRDLLRLFCIQLRA